MGGAVDRPPLSAVIDIAVAANVPIGEAFAIFPSKQAILTAFRNRIDQTVIAGTELDSLDGAVRDRLFDILMRRLEVLLPWKEGVAAIARDTLRDPESPPLIARWRSWQNVQEYRQAAYVAAPVFAV